MRVGVRRIAFLGAAAAVVAVFAAGAVAGGRAQATLTVQVIGIGVVTGPGINCGNGNTDCSETYTAGTGVTLVESPAGGTSFSGWGGPCTGTATTCTFTINADTTASAAFSTGTTTLTVAVTGNGVVTGPGIQCGAGNTDCSETYTANASVTLTATPLALTTFLGWGTACAGTQTTCTVTMNAAKLVTATFSTPTVRPTLTVAVSGNGIVTAPGISCGLGHTDCSEAYAAGTVVTLTASPASDATFLGWSQTSPLIVGFCGGGTLGAPPRTCNVTMDVSKAVAAHFGPSTPTPTPSGGFDVHKVGDPIVFITPSLKQATFRFFTNRAASAVMSTILNGSTVSVFRFSPHAGDVLVGPFLLTSSGSYVFHLTLTDAAGDTQTLDWALTGPGQFRPAGVFVNRGATVTRTSYGWAVHVRFTAPAAGTGSIRMTRAGRTVSSGTIRFSSGIVIITLPSRQAGYHRVTLTAHTARRAQILTWNVLLS